MAPKVLLVQTQPQAARFLTRFFEERGDEVTSVLDLGQAATRLAQHKPDLMVLDLHFPGNEWQMFLRILRMEYPDLKVIVTSKYPDVERELKAQEMGVKVFVRQPFTVYWLNKALDQVGLPTLNQEPPPPVPHDHVTPPVRMPMRLKITLPLIAMTLLFALVGAFMISQVILGVAQSRFETQLIDSGIQSADWMVRQEERLLETLRLVTNSQGVAEMTQKGEAEGLRSLLLPIAMNTDEETIEVLNGQGIGVFSMRKIQGGGPGEYSWTRGETFFQTQDIVRKALQQQSDAHGDKFAALIKTPWGEFFYVASPITNNDGQVVGVALVGRSPENMVNQIRREKLPYQVTFYDTKGRPLASTLYSNQESFPLALSQVSELLSGGGSKSLTRQIDVNNIHYSEIVGPWQAREGVDLGLMGVALQQAFLIRTNQLASFEIFAAIAIGVLLVVAVGFYLGGLISAPVQRLTEASTKLAQGDFEVQLDVKGNDEVAALAQSFNYMVTGLQEGIIFRDLLGHSASPELREQLRRTFSSGNLLLEGQDAIGTILITSIYGWDETSECNDPVKVFSWLNEYFSQLVPIVISQGGVVNQFDGGRMTSLFGLLPTPQNPQESANAACEAAMQMIAAVNIFNERRLERGTPPMITQISIHTGKVIAGALGSTERLYYTIMGNGVNFARELAFLPIEDYRNSGILISQATFEALADCIENFIIQPLGLYSVKGKTEQMQVYRLSSPPSSLRTKVI